MTSIPLLSQQGITTSLLQRYPKTFLDSSSVFLLFYTTMWCLVHMSFPPVNSLWKKERERGSCSWLGPILRVGSVYRKWLYFTEKMCLCCPVLLEIKNSCLLLLSSSCIIKFVVMPIHKIICFVLELQVNSSIHGWCILWVNQTATLFIPKKSATLLVLQEWISNATIAAQHNRQARAGLLNPTALLGRFMSQAAAEGEIQVERAISIAATRPPVHVCPLFLP